MEQESIKPSSIPVQVSHIVEEEVHLVDLIPSSRQLVGCCRTVLWSIVETCVRQEALTEAGLKTNKNETRTVEEVNDEIPFLDAQKQLLSDMVDLLGIPIDSNDENHSLPLQFGSKGTKKTLKNSEQSQPLTKKTRLSSVDTGGDGTMNNDKVMSTNIDRLLLLVPHDEATMVEENVYLARYDINNNNIIIIIKSSSFSSLTHAKVT